MLGTFGIPQLARRSKAETLTLQPVDNSLVRSVIKGPQVELHGDLVQPFRKSTLISERPASRAVIPNTDPQLLQPQARNGLQHVLVKQATSAFAAVFGCHKQVKVCPLRIHRVLFQPGKALVHPGH